MIIITKQSLIRSACVWSPIDYIHGAYMNTSGAIRDGLREQAIRDNTEDHHTRNRNIPVVVSAGS
jgi:hypothetical protein